MVNEHLNGQVIAEEIAHLLKDKRETTQKFADIINSLQQKLAVQAEIIKKLRDQIQDLQPEGPDEDDPEKDDVGALELSHQSESNLDPSSDPEPP